MRFSAAVIAAVLSAAVASPVRAARDGDAATIARLDLKQPDAGRDRGSKDLAWSDLNQIIVYYNAAIKRDPKDDDAYFHRGLAKLYAGAHNLKEPLLSPVYGDLTGFPPAILLSGTRDLFLSNTVRVHQKLLRAGGVAELLVFEGQSHAQYMSLPEAPETADAWTQVARFFSRHLRP